MTTTTRKKINCDLKLNFGLFVICEWRTSLLCKGYQINVLLKKAFIDLCVRVFLCITMNFAWLTDIQAIQPNTSDLRNVKTVPL